MNVDLAALILRVAIGTVMFAHGWNHTFRGGRLPGVARWFSSIGFRAPRLQAALASYTELAVGPMLVAGFLTPLTAAGVVGVMLVALVSNHLKNGYFIFRPGEGYEYVLTVLLAGLALGALGAGRWSVDHAAGIDVDGWGGLAVAAGLGGGLGFATLAAFWRPGRQRSA